MNIVNIEIVLFYKHFKVKAVAYYISINTQYNTVNSEVYKKCTKTPDESRLEN